jgi:predicted nucleotidyltransferase
MISEKDKIKLLAIAKKYNVSKLYLFGSHLDSNFVNDIDLAVEGVSGSEYFKFYSELIFNLSKPVDLIDLRKKSLFNKTIIDEGQLLYG